MPSSHLLPFILVPLFAGASASAREDRASPPPAASRTEASAPAQAGSLMLLTYPSTDVQLPARAFVADGPGPHPTLLLLHGFPGAELNLDLAHAARRAGWTVLAPHPRGAWGAPGTYSWSNALADARAALAWLRSPEGRERLRVDPARVAVVGHSLGGFLALQLAADEPSVAGVASLAGFDFGAYTGAQGGATPELVARTAEAWHGPTVFLAGTSGRALAEEAFARGDAWSLARRAPALADRPVLLLAARGDAVTEPALHHTPLVRALSAAGARKLTHAVLETNDHAFVDVRPKLERKLLTWLHSLGTAKKQRGSQSAQRGE